MKKRTYKFVAVLMIYLTAFRPTPVRADFFGGDLPLLAQIVANSIQQLAQLRSILSSGIDTFQYLQDINRGIRDAMTIIRTQNTTLSPGILSQLQTVDQLLGEVERLYGHVPNTASAPMQRTTDQSIAEAIHTHNEAYKYAATVDPEAERIKDYSNFVSPAGASRLTAQSMGVLITVMNQILRTNASILKLQSEQLAMGNHREKVESQHFKMQYDGLSRAFGDLHATYDLPSLSGNGR
jgi:hypothetical protein